MIKNEGAGGEGTSCQCQSRGVWLDVCPVIALMALGLAVRLYRLDHLSITSDEYMNYAYITAPLFTSYIPQRGFFAPDHLPLYFLVQFAWISIFGSGIFAVRMLSIGLGVAAIGLTYLVARLFVGRRASLIASLLAALSPMHLIYDRIMCYNALYCVLALLSIYGIVRAIRGDGARWWGVNIASNCLLGLTHPMGTLLWLVEGILLLLVRRDSFLQRAIAAATWSLPHVLSLLIALLWLYPQLPYSISSGEDEFDVTPLLVLVDLFGDDAISLSQFWMFWSANGEHAIFNAYREFVYGTTVNAWANRILITFSVASVLWLVLRAVRRARGPHIPERPCGPSRLEEGFLLLITVVPVLVLAILSVAVRPCLQAQYTPFSTHAIYIIIGAALMALPRSWMRRVGFVLVALTYGYQVGFVLPKSVDVDWRSAVECLREEAGDEDVILIRGRAFSTDHFRINARGMTTEILPAYTLEAICRKSARFLNARTAVPGKPEPTVWAAVIVMFDYPLLPMRHFETTLHDQGLEYTKRFFPGLGGLCLYGIRRPPSRMARESVSLPDKRPALDVDNFLRHLVETRPSSRTPASDLRVAVPWVLGNVLPSGGNSYAYFALAATEEGFAELGQLAAQKSIALRPASAFGYFALAIALWEQGLDEDAAVAYTKALAVDGIRFFVLYGKLLDAVYAQPSPENAAAEFARLDAMGIWIPGILRLRSGNLRYAEELQGVHCNVPMQHE